MNVQRVDDITTLSFDSSARAIDSRTRAASPSVRALTMPSGTRTVTGASASGPS